MKRAHIEQASLLWVVFWGAVAFDSAMTHRRTVEAVKRAEDADPYLEMYEGPVEQEGRVNRGLLWQAPTLARLRQLCRRAEWWTTASPLIALAGPPLFFLLGLGRRPARA
jgi:hypothetical protein